MFEKLDLTGQIYGTICIDGPAQSRSGKTFWNCHCIVCNKQKTIKGINITHKKTRSCGCGHFLTENDNINSLDKVCEICGKNFQIIHDNDISGNLSRKYCYECRPSCTNGITTVEAMAQLRRAMKKEAVKRMGGACIKCGYHKSLAALNFHHKNPAEKEFDLGKEGATHSWNDYWTEAQKCELLCANCHAEKHEQWRQNKQKE